DPDAPEGTTQGIVAVDKANAGSLHVPALRYEVTGSSYQVAETDPAGSVTYLFATTGVLSWLGEVEGDGRALARSALSPAIESTHEAKDFLRELLTEHGQMTRVEVMADAEVAGLSEASIKRAAAALRVRST